MSIKKSIYFITILLFISLTLQIFLVPTSARTANDEQKSYNVWNLESWNEASTTQWWSKGIFVKTQMNTQVIYNITNSQNNMTDPNSGYFSIGNATNIKTDNNDLASTFILSIYPWSPGFVTDPSNWTQNEDLAISSASSGYLQGNLTISNDISYNASGLMRLANKFSYSQNNTLGNQNSTLIYDKETGVLLYAKSEIFYSSLYIIELQFNSSTLINGSNYTQSSNQNSSTSNTSKTAPGFSFVFVMVTLITIPVVKKRLL